MNVECRTRGHNWVPTGSRFTVIATCSRCHASRVEDSNGTRIYNYPPDTYFPPDEVEEWVEEDNLKATLVALREELSQ